MKVSQSAALLFRVIGSGDFPPEGALNVPFGTTAQQAAQLCKTRQRERGRDHGFDTQAEGYSYTAKLSRKATQKGGREAMTFAYRTKTTGVEITTLVDKPRIQVTVKKL